MPAGDGVMIAVVELRECAFSGLAIGDPAAVQESSLLSDRAYINDEPAVPGSRSHSSCSQIGSEYVEEPDGGSMYTDENDVAFE